MKDKGVVAVAGGRSAERGAATETAIGVFVAFLAKDFLFELVLLLFVVRLLLRLQPPELIGEREIGEDKREFLDGAVFGEGGVGDGAAASLNFRLKPMEDGVDLADGGVAPVHFLGEVAGGGGVMTMLGQVVGGVDQHAEAAGSGIVDGVAGLRLKNPDQGIHDGRRGEEFTGLGAGVVGELS